MKKAKRDGLRPRGLRPRGRSPRRRVSLALRQKKIITE
jgi:hypothetical protein